MEKTDRELLIKEISSRLPYGIKAQVFGWDEEKGEVAIPLKVYYINTDGYISFEHNHYDVESIYIEDCRLYLRPMSSMTEEEKKEYNKTRIAKFRKAGPGYRYDGWWEYYDTIASFDYLNSIHIDYRGLIPKGLAIAVNKNNNPYKNHE